VCCCASVKVVPQLSKRVSAVECWTYCRRHREAVVNVQVTVGLSHSGTLVPSRGASSLAAVEWRYSVYSIDKINDFKITLNGVEIKRVKSCKYLGVIIDDELKFDVHIDFIYNKLIRYIGIFYKLAQKLPYFCHKNIYCAFVNSHVAYGIEIYANSSMTLLHKLHVLNNKLLHILQQ